MRLGRWGRVFLAVLAGIAIAGIAAAVSFSAISSDTDDDIAGVIADRGGNAAALGGTVGADSTVSPDVLIDDPSAAAEIAVVRENADGRPGRRLDIVQPTTALEFTAGISYPEAVTRLYMAAATGTALRGARLVPPLPAGKVAIVPADPGGSVTLDLRAPFGYDPSAPGRRIYPASIAFDAGLSVEEIDATPRSSVGDWPQGARVGIAILPPCMRLSSRDDLESPACGRGDLSVQDLAKLQGPRLP